MKKKIMIISVIVLVILVITTAILVPILIKKRIENEKNTALKNTKELVKVISKQCKNEEEKTYSYNVDDKAFKELKVEVSPDSGIIEVDDECSVTLSVIYGDYSVIKKLNKDPEIVDEYSFQNGTVIYFNPETKSVCEDYSEENINAGCMKWYTFNDSKDKNVVSLILDHNTTENIKWNKALEKLASDTNTWKVSARLIKVEELGTIIDTKIDTGSTKLYFFDSKLDRPLKTCYNKNTVDCNYGWVYDKTSSTCKDFGCLNNTETKTYGYWTSTVNKKDENLAWRVYFDGRIVSTNINDISSGIRPVIDLQKSIIK
jgi:hypothetical protein